MDTPDRSANGETPAAAPASRPSTVEVALALLWTNLALYALGLGIELTRGANTALSAWVITLVTIAIVAVLIGFIARRSNAARVIYVVLFVLGLLLQTRDPGALFASPPITASLNVVMFALQLAAIILLFSRAGAAWFKRPAST